MPAIRIAFAILLLTCAALYFFVTPVNSAVNLAFFMLRSTNVDMVAGYIRSFGVYAIIVSVLLMVFQSVAPLPAFVITFSNAVVFGWKAGAVLSWSGAVLGASLCFFIARVFGRESVEKLTGNPPLKQADDFFERYGMLTVLSCRLLPFVPFDLVSYAAGLTSMTFLQFFIATGIGQLPAVIIYSYAGGMLTGRAKLTVTALLIISALGVVVFIVKSIYDTRNKDAKSNNQEG